MFVAFLFDFVKIDTKLNEGVDVNNKFLRVA